MHELDICLSIINLLEQHARQATPPIQRIKAIRLQIGELAGIDVEAIRFSFPIASAHTLAKDATLDIRIESGIAFCHRCQKNVTISSLLTPCALCGHYDYDITQGKSLKITQIEVI